MVKPAIVMKDIFQSKIPASSRASGIPSTLDMVNALVTIAIERPRRATWTKSITIDILSAVKGPPKIPDKVRPASILYVSKASEHK